MKTRMFMPLLGAAILCVSQAWAQEIAPQYANTTNTGTTTTATGNNFDSSGGLFGNSATTSSKYANAGTHAYAHGWGCHRPWGFDQASTLWQGYCNEAYVKDECGFLGLKCIGGCGLGGSRLGGRCGGCGQAGCGECGGVAAGGSCCESAWPQDCGSDCGAGCGGGLLRNRGCGPNVLDRLRSNRCCRPTLGLGGCCDAGGDDWQVSDGCDSGCDCRHGFDLFSRLKSARCCRPARGFGRCNPCCDAGCGTDTAAPTPAAAAPEGAIEAPQEDTAN